MTLSVPPDAIARVSVLVSHASAARYVLFSCPDDPDIAASASVHNARTLASGGGQTAALEVPADGSSRIRHRADNTATTLAELVTQGWIDSRGRDQEQEHAMATVYVSRDARGRITGVYLNQQPGYAAEAVDDQAPEVRAFMADASIYRRAGAARLKRQFRRRLARDPFAALVERAKAGTTP